MSEILEILHFDEETKAFEQSGETLQASAHLYRIWKEDPTSLPKLLRAAMELWLTFLDISENLEINCEPFSMTHGLPEYEKMFQEEIKTGLSLFCENSMFLAFFGHMFTIQFTFFTWLWDRSQGTIDSWINNMMKKLDNGNLACQLDPGNLFAKAMQICGTDPVSVCAHKKDCAAFWREISIDRWEHGYVGEYLWYWLEGPTQKAKSGTSAVE